MIVPLDKALSLPVTAQLEVLSLCFVTLHWGSQTNRTTGWKKPLGTIRCNLPSSLGRTQLNVSVFGSYSDT